MPRKTRKAIVGPAEDIERRAREREYRELARQLRWEHWQAVQTGEVRA